MNKNFGKDMTKGSIPRHILSLSLPILLGNLFTTGYSIINTIWIGRAIGGNAVAAVAVSYPVILIMVALVSGISLAASILVSKYFGAKDNLMIQKVVNNCWLFGLIMSIIITSVGIIASSAILNVFGTPKEIISEASGYLKIMFLSFAFMFFSNLVVSILRGIGDTFTPMIFMIIGTLLNAILDPVFILGFGFIPKLGLNGAAFASLLSIATATVLGIAYSRKKYSGMPINPDKWELKKNTIMQILKIGFPSFVQQALISVSSAFMTSFVTSFGTIAIASFGITSRIDSIAIMPALAMSMAVSTITAQNLGAHKNERIRDIFKWGVVVNFMIISVIAIIVIGASKSVMSLFINDENIINTGVGYLRIVGFGYFLFALSFITNGIINGSGKTFLTMIISAFSLCVIRIPLAAIMMRSSLGLSGIWIVIVISFAATTILSLVYYLKGSWRLAADDAIKTVAFENA